jgi:hypothetical protein
MPTFASTPASCSEATKEQPDNAVKAVQGCRAGDGGDENTTHEGALLELSGTWRLILLHGARSARPSLSDLEAPNAKVLVRRAAGLRRRAPTPQDLIDVFAASRRWNTADLEEFGRRHARDRFEREDLQATGPSVRARRSQRRYPGA